MDISPEVIALGHEIFLAGDHTGFVRQIDTAVQAAHLRVEERRQLALANDWQEKAGQFSAVIVQIVNKKRARSKAVLRRLVAGIPARFRRRRLAEGTQA
jgi:hypothetical protein